ncbi:MAG: putative bifunctional diguanylate cyclase/phosphodiesterase [Phycisphaerae bacterium]
MTKTTPVELRARPLEADTLGAVVDRSGKICQVTQGLAAFLGLPAGQIVGQAAWWLIAADANHGAAERLRRAMAAGRLWHGRTVGCRGDGRLYTASSMALPLGDDGGTPGHIPGGWILIQRDHAEPAARAQPPGPQRLIDMVVADEPLESVIAEAESLLRRGRSDLLVAVRLTEPLDADAGGETPAFDLAPGDAAEAGLASAKEAASRSPSPPGTVPIRTVGGREVGQIDFVAAHGASTAPDYGMARQVAAILTLAVQRDVLRRRLVRQSTHDALTGLPNRKQVDAEVRRSMARAEREGEPMAVMFINLDGFRTINELHGHSMGDQLLRASAARLLAVTRTTDALFRLGGDEFALVSPMLRDTPLGSTAARRILAALNDPLLVDGHELRVSASIGIACYPGDGTGPEELLRNANAAMLRAKGQSVNRFDYATPTLSMQARRRLEMEGCLHAAVERQDMRVFYQPLVDTRGRLLGVEALLRWHDPKLGTVSPADFIPLAESTGLIHTLGDWVIRQACQQAARWELACMPLRVNVNVSAVQFLQPGFVGRVLELINESGIHPGRLELELTESMLIGNPHAVVGRLKQLRAAGVRISIDDFGTGYSSLAYLHELPVDAIKIDRAFVRGLVGRQSVGADDTGSQTTGRRRGRTAVIEMIIALCRTLNLQVIAEGVETPLQLRYLRRLGCDVYQGYHFARPSPAEEIPQFARQFGIVEEEPVRLKRPA